MIDAITALSMTKQNQKQPKQDFNRRQYNRLIKLTHKRIVKACKDGQTDCCICSYYDINILNEVEKYLKSLNYKVHILGPVYFGGCYYDVNISWEK